MKRIFAALLIGLVLAPLAGCTTNPATGESSFTAFMSPEDEQRVGTEVHPKLVEQFGGEYRDPQLAAYVDKVGQTLARTTEVPNIRYSFTILDDEGINAFALPGGYVHVTRGLLALASNEAELAGVLAHELGHINARHSAQRYSQAVAANIGASILGVVGAAAGIPGVGDVAGYGAQAYLQSYSREQELEADTLAIRYMTRAGYDPDALVSFFRKLDAYAQLEATIAGDPGAADRFDIMASHPRTADRIGQADHLAGATRVASPKDAADPYLSHIDGLVYGDSPSQGIRRGRDFAHPGLGIAFRVPPGFDLSNSPGQVTARGPGGALIAFDMDDSPNSRAAQDMTRYVGQTWGGRLDLRQVHPLTVNGMAAATGATRVRTRSGVADVRLVAIRERPGRIYRFIFLTPPQLTESLRGELERTTYGFHRLSPDEAAAIKPLKVKVVTVKASDTPSALAERMAFVDYRLDRFLTLNGLRRGEGLKPGEKVKLIAD